MVMVFADAVRRSPRERVLKIQVLVAAFVLAALAPPAAAQLFDEMPRRALPPNGDDSRALACGDVDGDGDLDLIVGNADDWVRLYLGDGAGAFTDATLNLMPLMFGGCRALALGDVDGDGDLDLAVGNSRQYLEQNRLYLNNGTGRFTDATTSRLPSDTNVTHALALGDVDGDGDLDLVVGNYGAFGAGEQNRLYLNNGSGVFTDATIARMPVASDFTNALVLGDVDGDGDLDLVVGNHGWQNLLYLNNGSGVFTDVTAARMPPAMEYTTSLAFGDVDGDGDLDLAVGNGDAEYWPYLRQNRLYLNDGTGTFIDATAIQMPVDTDHTTALVFGDVDGDGDLDLAIANEGAQQDRLYLNDGTGTFMDGTPTHMPVDVDASHALAFGDVDRDGDLDLLVGNGDKQPNRLYVNGGAGTFADATAARLPFHADYTKALATGDVDGDGDVDLVVGNPGTGSQLYLNDGNGWFVDVTVRSLPFLSLGSTAPALGDVDGDGDLDLAIGSWAFIASQKQNRLYLNDGLGRFVDVTASHLPADVDPTTAIAFGDIDGDGDLDLLVANSGAQNRLYLNDGTGRFTDVTTSRMPFDRDASVALAIGDVDSDGDLDVVVGNDGTSNRLYLNNGAGGFTSALTNRMPGDSDSTRALALGDLDGDGDLDLVMVNYSSQNRLYLNDGTGTFSDATANRMPANGSYLTSLAIADVDDDGDLDLVIGATNSPIYSTGQANRLYVNDGAGRFTDLTTAWMPAHTDDTFAVALADVDSDGDPDLIVGNTTRGGFSDPLQRNRLYINLRRQFDAPSLLQVGHTYRLDGYSRLGPPSQIDVVRPYFATAPGRVPAPPYGTIGIDPSHVVALPPFVVDRPAGMGSLLLPIPNLPVLLGSPIFAQAMLTEHPVQSRLTNVIAEVIR